MTTITSGSVLSASIRVDNYQDEDRVYNIVADINISKDSYEYNNGSINNGSVSKDGSTVATFYSNNDNNLTINYNIGDSDVRAAIQFNIERFCTEARKFINEATISIN